MFHSEAMSTFRTHYLKELSATFIHDEGFCPGDDDYGDFQQSAGLRLLVHLDRD